MHHRRHPQILLHPRTSRRYQLRPPGAALPPAGGKVQVTYEVVAAAPQDFCLADGQTVVVGSAEGADQVVLGDAQIAARHFELIADGDACVVRDLDSPVGIHVNGEPATWQILSSGDVVLAGSTLFRLTIHTTPQFAASSTATDRDHNLPSPTASPLPTSHVPSNTHSQSASIPSASTAPLNQASSDQTESIHTGGSPPQGDAPAQSPGDRSSSPAGHMSVAIEGRGADLRVVPLHQGQQVFGSSPDADVCVDNDPLLAPQHFKILADGDACAIYDLENPSGTTVNGERVSLQALAVGDIIEAGATRFVFGTQPVPTDQPAVVGDDVPVDGATATASGIMSTSVNSTTQSESQTTSTRWQQTDCLSGVCAFEGELGGFQDLLNAFSNVCYVVNMPQLTGHSLPDPVWLYDLFASDAAAMLSPAILSEDEAAKQPGLVREAVSKHGLFGVVFDGEFSDLVIHLRAVARGQKCLGGAAEADLMFAARSFSELEELFRTGDAEFVDFLFSKIQALVFPRDDGQRSALLAKQGFESQLASVISQVTPPQK